MKTIILFILFAVMIQAQTHNVGQTNANITSALTKALVQPDSNTVYRNAINTKLNKSDSTTIYATQDDLNQIIELPDTTGIPDGYELQYNGAPEWVYDKTNDLQTYPFTRLNPDSATAFGIRRTKAAITIDSVFAIVQGTSAVVDFNIVFGTNRTSGTNVFSASQSADNVTVGEVFSTFSDNTIPINNMIWINITNTDNNPEEIQCEIYYH
jgi:hypothetical protein